MSTTTYEHDQELIEAIKELELKDKLKAIALSHYRKLWLEKEEALNQQIEEMKKQHLHSLLPFQKEANDIITGKRAPKAEELGDAHIFLQEEEKSQQKEALTAEPLKDFWAQALLNAEEVADICSEEDLAVFKHLERVENTYEANSLNFTLKFYFSDNEYFTNKVLEKKFIFEKGNQPVKTQSTVILWKEGKNITKKIVKKKQRNKKTGASREVEQEVEASSFFQFFKDRFDQDNEQENLQKVQHDFAIAQNLAEEVIPGALDYYLGIQKVDDDMMSGDGEDDDGEDLDEEDDD